MTGLMAMMVFAGAMTLAMAAIWSTVAPQWRRIARLAAGGTEMPFQPLAGLAQAERRIAVRRWASTPLPAAATRLRAAA